MSFDTSRFTFQPEKDFFGVVMQQGRVLLDADWNEWLAEIDRRIRAGTLDTVGRAVVPRETPDGFLVTVAAGKLEIGRGRIYVDGILAENHGEPPEEWDSVLAELRGSTGTGYADQPYYPNAPALPSGGPHLVYLDVWRREVTFLEDPALVEKAVAVDTTARLQTVWQVKVLADVGKISCATPDDQIPGWVEATAPSAGRLTAATADVPGQPDPCLIPPGGGYKGLENQLYRIEIHDGGAAGAATFKWSRDDASVATRVANFPDASHLVVESTGKDEVLRFSDGDWIEITDDWLELGGQSGEIRQIAVGGGVDDATRTITLTSAVTAGLFPVDAQGNPDPARHTRIRRWDQKGKIFKSDGSTYADLDAGGSTGLVTVPPAGTSLLLENGIVVGFDLDPAGGAFKTGDCWAFAARATDASIETLDKAPPRAVHHHYARLALVTFPDNATDCRVLWPPEQAAGEGCDCSVCVTADGHNSGAATLQQAVNAVTATGGTVCMGPGVYALREPLQIADASSLRLRGHGEKTVLAVYAPGSAITIHASTDVVLENFNAIGSSDGSGNGLIAIDEVNGCELRRLGLVCLSSQAGAGAAVTLANFAVNVVVRDCMVMADIGVANGAGAKGNYLAALDESEPLYLADVKLSDNWLLCAQRGVSFGSSCLHLAETRIAGNLISGCNDSAVAAVGAALPGSPFNVLGNTCLVLGSGIVTGLDGARIGDNDISLGGGDRAGDGIALETGLDPGGIDHCRIIGNRIIGSTDRQFALNPGQTLAGTGTDTAGTALQARDAPGHGIAIRTRVNSAMIKQNVIDGLSGGGIVMEGNGSAGHLDIENNELTGIASGFNAAVQPPPAIGILATTRAEIANNFLGDFARDAVQSPLRVALLAAGAADSDLRIAGNRIRGVGPAGQAGGNTVAIEILAPFVRAEISGNTVTRRGSEDEKLGAANWQALRVGTGDQKQDYAANAYIAYAANDESRLMLTDNAVLLAAIVLGRINIDGNHLEADVSSLSLAVVGDVESCLFTGNLCVQPSASKQAIVSLSGAAVVAGNNRIRSSRDQPALDIENARATVVGNITSGAILLNGQSLGDPWKPLNILAP